MTALRCGCRQSAVWWLVGLYGLLLYPDAEFQWRDEGRHNHTLILCM
jgi:hypothetical protein